MSDLFITQEQIDEINFYKHRGPNSDGKLFRFLRKTP